ncbi:MAG: glycosyl hydrolase family 95 catalytic domain-containing protein [Spirosomataceae bacterium]
MKRLFNGILGLSLLAWTSVEGQWEVRAESPRPEGYFGVTVANGMIGLVSSPEPLKVKEVVLNGAFDTYGRGRVSNILKVFELANLDLDVNGKRMTSRDISNYSQTLRMQDGTFVTSFDYAQVHVESKLLALRHLPFTTMLEVEVKANAACEITPHSFIQAPDMLRDVKNFYHVIDRPHSLTPLMTSVAKSPTGRHTIAASNSLIFEEERGQEPRLIHEEWDYGMHRLKFTKKLQAGETYRFTVVGSVISSAHVADPHNEAERLTLFASLEKTARLRSKHQHEWAKLWESDILIEGDPEAQRAARMALYHLYSFVREDAGYSLSPMGLSGLGYNGHVFWDTELWMYPPILLLKPDMAKSILDYRFNRLEAARYNAKAHGYKGAMFPWESDQDGQEATPIWALTGPFQHHITACVGFSFWKYFQVTQDKEWLQEKGYVVLKDVADFWVSRVEKGEKGQYHIRNVVCADEWAENVDDNAFTNGIAKEVLGYAIQAAQILGKVPDPRWKEVQQGLVVLKMSDGTTKEHASYQGEPIKQADVNLLAYPLKQVTEPSQVKKDLDYYWARLGDNQPGMKGSSPAMAHAVFSILYNRTGQTDKAYAIYLDSYKPNEVGPFKVLAETAGGTNPYFATGAGGFLQALLNGFGGLDISDAGIVGLKTKLPSHWKSLTVKGVGVEKKTIVIK